MLSSHPKNSGFTLVEVLVTIFIFGLAFTATSFILTTNLHSANAIRNNFIASGLVQEGAELVRNIRDNDWHVGNSFGTSLPDGTYRIQWDSRALIPIGANPNLKSDPALNNLFNYDSGNDTIFNRTIIISTPVVGVEKEVVVNVSWVDRGAIRTISAEEHLFNWR